MMGLEAINSLIIIYIMGKQGHGHHEVEAHHDNHHHEEHHGSQSHEEMPGQMPTLKSNKPNDPLNFTKKHPLFEIYLDKKGPEFSEIDDRRLEYINKYAGKVPISEIPIPKNIPGLIAKTGNLPSNRLLWRPTSSFERNGIFNIYTHSFNTRFIIPFFFSFLLYGWWGHATYALYKTRYEDNDEYIGNFYDKLNTRFIPPTKIWLRPG